LKISSTVDKTYKVLVEGSTLAFINHIKVHKTIMTNCKLKQQEVEARSLMIKNRREIASLNVAGPAANQVQIENLVEANRELQDTVRTLKNEAFDYLEKLVSSALAMKWQLIMNEEAVGVAYVSLASTKPGLKRGKDFTTLSPCYFRFVGLVAPQDAAERLRRYMTTNMVLNTDKGITIEQGVHRVCH
jgi:hypothetical protein